MKATPKKKPRKKERDPVAEMKKRLLKAGFTPERIQAKRELQRELGRKYPGMHAVIREKWDGDKIVEPYLLAVAATLEEIYRLADALPEEVSEGAIITYIWPPNKAMGF